MMLDDVLFDNEVQHKLTPLDEHAEFEADFRCVFIDEGCYSSAKDLKAENEKLYNDKIGGFCRGRCCDNEWYRAKNGKYYGYLQVCKLSRKLSKDVALFINEVSELMCFLKEQPVQYTCYMESCTSGIEIFLEKRKNT